MGVPSENGHCWPDCRRWATADQRGVPGLYQFGSHRLVLRRGAVGRWAGSDELAEDGIDPVDDRHGGSEVLGQRHGGGVQRAPGQQVEGDVGPPEPVNGLLGVTDQEQGSRYGGEAIELSVGCSVGIGQQQGQLELHGVGVLEFIEQDVPVTLVQCGPDCRPRGGIGQQIVGDDQ